VDDSPDRFRVLRNATAPAFALGAAPAATPGRASWRQLGAPGEGTRIADVAAFADHLVVHYRKNAATHLRVIPNDGEPYDIAFDEEVRSVEPDANHEYETAMFRLSYESLVTPPSVYDFDLGSRELILRKQQRLLGAFDATNYASEREWATAPDGARVPVSIVHRRDVPRDGTAPMLLYGY